MNILLRIWRKIFGIRQKPTAEYKLDAEYIKYVDNLVALAKLEARQNETLAQLAIIKQKRAANDENQNKIGSQMNELAAEISRLEVAIQYEEWVVSLIQRFGNEVAAVLANQEIDVGMQLAHLYASFGQPDKSEQVGDALALTYGNRRTGSYFEANSEGIITRAEIVSPPLPPVDIADS